ncbi:ATP-dependent DNA ligase [Patescibacteria group bacterium]|nr:ATP-dependent DNA ligase [Patescibacteria group bacterium]MCL5409391.1 ATP-dependent DNA ligase [Patescibacteria group bacterium]
MTFAKLAEYLDRLEETSSRLSLIDILAELFNEAKDEEIKEIVYLIQGRVAPFYEPVEIGMAEKSVAAAIAQAYGVEKEEVLSSFGQIGDLGKVAQNLNSQAKITDSHIAVKEVFAQLLQIARTSGEGTVDKKLNILSDLLKQINASSAKHLARIPLGTSRLGIGDPTVLDGLAKARAGGRENRKILEAAYNKTSDLGLIAQTLCQNDLKSVEELDVEVGRPIRSQLAERLPDAKTILEKMGGEVHMQYKYDGFRVQIHKNGDQVRLFSRNLEETTAMMPDVIAGVKKQIKAKTAIFDSEALAYNKDSEEFLPFQETTKRRRKYQVEEMAEALPLKAFVFDVMYLNGTSLVDLSLRDRMEKLTQTVSGDGVLIAQPGEFTQEVEKIETVFNDALTKGLEGLVLKKPDSKYEAGARNFNWVKLKRHSAGELKDTVDCVILGYVFGRGKRAEFGAGALLVGVYDSQKDEFVTVSKIGTGLSDEEWREIHQRADKIKLERKPARVNSILVPSVWIKPEIVIEVLADEITRSPVHTAGKTENEPGFALRFPRLVRFRDSDKKAEDATTVKELIEMYKLQYSAK